MGYCVRTLLLSMGIVICGTMCPEHKKTSFLSPAQGIKHTLSGDLKYKPVVHLRSLAHQDDKFSCGTHALFNALAIDRAIKHPRGFDAGLRETLADPKSFEKVHAAINQETKGENRALNGHEIMKASERLPFSNKVLSLFLTEDKQLMIPCLYATLPPDCLSKPLTQEQKEKIWDIERKKNVYKELAALMNQVKAPRKAAHFVCNVGNHWMLSSVVTDHNKQAKVYIVGSWNEPIESFPTIKRYLNELLKYVNQINKR